MFFYWCVLPSKNVKYIYLTLSDLSVQNAVNTYDCK